MNYVESYKLVMNIATKNSISKQLNVSKNLLREQLINSFFPESTRMYTMGISDACKYPIWWIFGSMEMAI